MNNSHLFFKKTSFLFALAFLGLFACKNNQTADTPTTPPTGTSTTPSETSQIKSISGDSLIRIASESSAKVNELVVYIDNLRKTIFDEAGGPMKEDPARPVHYQDTIIGTKLLIQKGKGYDLMKKIQSTRSDLLALIGSPEELVATLPLKTEVPIDAATKDWVKANFEDVPVALIFPKLIKIKSEAREADQIIREHLE